METTAPRTADAFELLMAEHYPALVRRLTAVLRDADVATDVAQDTYLRAYRAWNRFDGADARAWLYTIGLRLAFNEQRRRRRWSWVSWASSASAPLRTADLDLHSALAGLRADHRAALLLHVVDGYTQAEIAAMLDVAPGTVASWLSRAKAHLREVLNDG